MELENIPFDLNELFSSCRTLIMPKAIEKGLTLYFYAEPSLGKRPLGDPTRLRQVFVNLLSNAIKFTNAGMIKLHSVLKNVGDNNITMYFEVKDSGIGMSSDEIRKIFDPFTQAESGTMRKYGGTGLGLAITKDIVEVMGGMLMVESTPGIGSKFSFELTFNTVDADDKTLDNKIVFNDIEKPAFEGEILLCEDNTMNQQVICEHLARIGLKTAIAVNGKFGVDMVKRRIERGEKQYDLIFMDMHMPVMDGLEAAEKIMEFNTGVPIVAMTANIMADDREMYKLSGMNDCLGKPFTSQELWRCLMKYLKPVGWQEEDLSQRERSESDLRQKLINRFVNNNQKIIGEIKKAIKAGDIKLAHRIVHTLKSNAGQLHKTLLQKVAEEVEHRLKNGENYVSEKHMEALETELNAVLRELKPLVFEMPRPEKTTLDDAAIRELLEPLALFLEDNNSECLMLVDKLRVIPGSEELILQIEAFDFEKAKESLAELKRKILK
jgi:CheY-like chemotaxis protein